MITPKEILDLLKSTESYRVERTTSTGNMDKFCEAICAFSNDMPGSRKNGYLIIGASDDGSIAGMRVDDALLKKIAGIRSDGNILPLPTMSVERFPFPEGDLLVAEAMKIGKYVNKFNRGVARVQEMLKENGNSRAEFDVSTITAFCVRAYATAEVNLSADNKPCTSQGTSQGTSQNNITIEEKIIEFCIEPHTLAEIAAYCGFQNKRKFRERYLNPLLGLRIQKNDSGQANESFSKICYNLMLSVRCGKTERQRAS